MDGSGSDAKNRHMVLDHSKLFKKVPNVVPKISKIFKKFPKFSKKFQKLNFSGKPKDTKTMPSNTGPAVCSNANLGSQT